MCDKQKCHSSRLCVRACVCVSTTSHHFFYLSVFIIIVVVVHTDCLVVNMPADQAMLLLLLLLLAARHTSSVERNEPSGTTAAWLPWKRVCALPSPHTLFDFYDMIFWGGKNQTLCAHNIALKWLLYFFLFFFVFFFLLSWFVLKYHFEWRYCHM